MELLQSPVHLTSRVLKTQLVDWKKFQYIQQADFKNLSPEAKTKLKKSIVENQFTQPFYVWHDKKSDVVFCLDGRHRTIAMEELMDEGTLIPDELPATFIDCEDANDAAKLVLIYSSIYAKITQQGLFDFLQMYDLQYETIREQMDVPEFSTDRFEQKFDFFHTGESEEPQIEERNSVVTAGDIFEINGHRIACGSFADKELIGSLMQGKLARILNCDPPYNLSANFFLKENKKHNNHKDFAVGHGEMSDEEFVQFLKGIMQAAVENSLPGAIHYIFMDWRHVWHMTEAGRQVYGSPQPKQICVWNKDMMANGSFYRAKHELCFVFNSPQAKALWKKDFLDHGGSYKDNNELIFIFKAGDEDIKHLSHLDLKDRIRSNMWNYPSATSMANPDRYELKNHPTPKPVQMIADSILDTTNPGDIVIDFFVGSGTCLIACDQTKRLCYCTDIDPVYIQSTIKRFLNHCAKKGIDVNFSHINGSLTINDFKHATKTND